MKSLHQLAGLGRKRSEADIFQNFDDDSYVSGEGLASHQVPPPLLNEPKSPSLRRPKLDLNPESPGNILTPRKKRGFLKRVSQNVKALRRGSMSSRSSAQSSQGTIASSYKGKKKNNRKYTDEADSAGGPSSDSDLESSQQSLTSALAAPSLIDIGYDHEEGNKSMEGSFGVEDLIEGLDSPRKSRESATMKSPSRRQRTYSIASSVQPPSMSDLGSRESLQFSPPSSPKKNVRLNSTTSLEPPSMSDVESYDGDSSTLHFDQKRKKKHKRRSRRQLEKTSPNKSDSLSPRAPTTSTQCEDASMIEVSERVSDSPAPLTMNELSLESSCELIQFSPTMFPSNSPSEASERRRPRLNALSHTSRYTGLHKKEVPVDDKIELPSDVIPNQRDTSESSTKVGPTSSPRNDASGKLSTVHQELKNRKRIERQLDRSLAENHESAGKLTTLHRELKTRKRPERKPDKVLAESHGSAGELSTVHRELKTRKRSEKPSDRAITDYHDSTGELRTVHRELKNRKRSERKSDKVLAENHGSKGELMNEIQERRNRREETMSFRDANNNGGKGKRHQRKKESGSNKSDQSRRGRRSISPGIRSSPKLSDKVSTGRRRRSSSDADDVSRTSTRRRRSRERPRDRSKASHFRSSSRSRSLRTTRTAGSISCESESDDGGYTRAYLKQIQKISNTQSDEVSVCSRKSDASQASRRSSKSSRKRSDQSKRSTRSSRSVKSPHAVRNSSSSTSDKNPLEALVMSSPSATKLNRVSGSQSVSPEFISPRASKARSTRSLSPTRNGVANPGVITPKSNFDRLINILDQISPSERGESETAFSFRIQRNTSMRDRPAKRHSGSLDATMPVNERVVERDLDEIKRKFSTDTLRKEAGIDSSSAVSPKKNRLQNKAREHRGQQRPSESAEQQESRRRVKGAKSLGRSEFSTKLKRATETPRRTKSECPSFEGGVSPKHIDEKKKRRVGRRPSSTSVSKKPTQHRVNQRSEKSVEGQSLGGTSTAAQLHIPGMPGDAELNESFTKGTTVQYEDVVSIFNF